MSSTPGPVMELLGRIAYELHQMKPLLPTYLHLLASAIFPIYTAAHASLARPSSAAPLVRKKDVDVNELQDEEISPTIESLSPSDAILFPVLAGATLASLYFILKWLQDPALLNYYLGLYFAVVGLFFAVKFVKDGLATARSLTLPNQYSHQGQLWKLKSGAKEYTLANGNLSSKARSSPLPGVFSVVFRDYNSLIWSFRNFIYTKLRLSFRVRKLIGLTTVIDTLDLTSILIATPLVYYHTFINKPWFLTNFLGFSFCYGSLQITTPGTSWTGTLLLCALFFYDIYFVFFTPMMVTVATKLDVPIKLLFPRPDGCIRPVGVDQKSEAWQDYLNCLAKKRTMAMLGLGDIVIPGMMLAFALRFDLYLYYRKLSNKDTRTVSKDGKTDDNEKKVAYLPATGSWGERFWTSTKLRSPELQAKQFPKTYFNASVVGYVLGMIVTVVVMQVAQHAQPALLYLVPGVLLSLWGVALVQGDFKALWEYSEVPVDEERNDAKKSKAEKKDKKQKVSTNDKAKPDEGDATVETKQTTEQDSDTIELERPAEKNDRKPFSESVSKKSGKNNTDDADSDTTDLIYFSLSVVHPSKPQAHPTEPRTPERPQDTAETNTPSTDEFSMSSPSSDTDNEANDNNNHQYTVNTVNTVNAVNDTTNPTRRVTRSSATKVSNANERQLENSGRNLLSTGDSEPVIKRRKKA